jgi:hypothetical protein
MILDAGHLMLDKWYDFQVLIQYLVSSIQYLFGIKRELEFSYENDNHKIIF